MVKKKWTARAADPRLVQALVDQLQIAAPLAQVLVARGLQTPEQAYTFLHPSKEQLHDPFRFSQMSAAVERLQTALERSEKVLVYGDYDTDGITSTALLTGVLRRCGMNVDYFIPERLEDGYGLSCDRLEQAREMGFSLIITVDCGTKESEPVQHALELGLDLLVTDHHQVPDRLPPAPVILNPQHPDSGYPDKNICGVGVAYKLARAVAQHLGTDPEEVDEYLDLVALGTIADVVPLVGENRILVREGLSRLRSTTRTGLQALIEVAQTVQDRIGVRQVGYQLAPRLNALGRLGDATAGVKLLLTDNMEEALEIAGLMNEANSDRQRLQEEVFNQIRRRATGEPELFEQPVLVLSHADWHRGVIGIVASKLVERYYRPSLLFSVEGEVAHGSARSVPGFHITDALSECSDLLERFGGHEMAAGVTMPARNLPQLQERLGSILTEQLGDEGLSPHLLIDAEVRLEEVNEALVEQLAQMGPFGEGNRRPLFAAYGLSAGDTARVVGNGSLKFMVAQGNALLDAIAFGQGFRLDSLDLNQLDVAFHPEMNEWRGQRSLQLNVVDVRTSEGPSPVSEETSRPAKSSVTVGGIRRITAKTLADCWKELEPLWRERFFVVVVDDEPCKAQLAKQVPGAEERITDKGPGEWAYESQPEAVLVVCGRRGPERTRQLLGDLRLHCPRAELILAVVKSELEEVQQSLRELYPDRERLLAVYQTVEKAFRHKEFRIEDALGLFEECSPAHLASCLKVFEELSLLERRSEGNRVCLRQARARRDLLMSPTFRQGQALCERWTGWLQALQGSEEQLAQFLNA